LRRADRHNPGIVNGLDAQGFTPLTLATLGGHYDRVQLLLACCQKIDIDQPDRRGNTPLILAAARGDYVITSRFLDAGADVTRENRKRLSPLMMTIKNWKDHDRVRYSFTFEAVVRALEGLMDKGGESREKARTILEAAAQAASASDMAEQWRIVQTLIKE
jgi:hypothetical protein